MSGRSTPAVRAANVAKGLARAPLPPRPLPSRYDSWNDGLLVKEDADCCQLVASRDPHGRPPIGFCGPDCERRR